jgi:hypothetical protein
MKNDFRLTESAADELLREFRHQRDVADDNGRSEEARTWGEAARLLHEAQLASFNKRAAAARRRRLTRL